ncbi:hypothetical protein G4B88_031501 [Cannabis sativa]|uniref:Reverse transcriptase zinc-binding domain-containing protein n=1 Tax=Cannabis sativa TaxID=3483 RepID=A0A7J6G4B6_CANSA|nr:hypothetical protein G4B88_031501 [Cannabis sativa]
MLYFLFGTELGDEIGRIQIVKNGEDDFIAWKNSKTRNFTVKGAYWDAQIHRFGGVNRLWGWIWNAKVHPRLSMMMWRVCANVLPTEDIFKQPEHNNCCFCGVSRESPLHLFASCSFATVLWFCCPFLVRIDTIQADSITDLLRRLCEGADEDLRMLCCYAVIFDIIWNIRNIIHHDKDAIWSVDQVRREIHKRFFEFSSAQVSSPTGKGEGVEMAVCLNITTKSVLVVDGSFSNDRYGCGVLALATVLLLQNWKLSFLVSSGRWTMVGIAFRSRPIQRSWSMLSVPRSLLIGN